MTAWALAVASVLGAAPGPSALERAAAEVSAIAQRTPLAPPIGLYVEGSPAPLPRALASLTAARLAKAKVDVVVVDARDAAAAERAARDQGLVSLLRLTVGLEGTRATVRGDALTLRESFWAAELPSRGPGAAVVALAFEPDAELQTLAGTDAGVAQAPLELRLTSLAKLPSVPVALAAGEVDGGKRAAVAVLVGERLALYSGEGKALARAELAGAPASRPTREPFALLSLGPGRVTVWSGRKERAEAFAVTHGALRPAGAVDAVPYDALSLKLEPSFNRASAEVAWAGKSLALPAGPQAVALFGPAALFAWPDGSASVGRGVSPTGRVTGVGCALALADLDGDGTPEVVLTTSKTAGESDELKVVTLAAFEAAQARGATLSEVPVLWQQPLKGRAVVAAAGDVDGDGQDEVVLGLWFPDGQGELLALRRVLP